MIKIDYVKNLHPIFTKTKRIKIIVGGRGSTKSTGIADYVAAKMTRGELWCCARENQNSIEESVHRTMLDEISRLGLQGFDDTKTAITHASGGRNFYRGLSRNITSLKSTLSGIDGLWIEEGEDISANTLRVLTASVRLNAQDTERLLGGRTIESIEELDELLADSDIDMPEIIITMNRGARTGAIAQQWLARAEKELSRCGYYEDNLIMVVEMNYTDMPRSWFIASGLEQERLDDLDRLSDAMYGHKWLGWYLDEVEGSIIKGVWFDASIDAHKLERLRKVFEPKGAIRCAHDPSDTGGDNKGYCARHDSIVKRVVCSDKGEIDEGCDWAIGLAKQDNADIFIVDADGMGAGLKRQVSDAFNGTKTKYHMFKGSLSGSGQDRADEIYMPSANDAQHGKPKSYSETFKNNRAQYSISLADKFYNTYKCVIRGEYIDPSEMISIDSDGVEDMARLRSEVTRVPIKQNNTGLTQIMSKQEMKALEIESPGMFDSLMMSEYVPKSKKARAPIQYARAGTV
jgi:phage terminase large subunit